MEVEPRGVSIEVHASVPRGREEDHAGTARGRESFGSKDKAGIFVGTKEDDD